MKFMKNIRKHIQSEDEKHRIKFKKDANPLTGVIFAKPIFPRLLSFSSQKDSHKLSKNEKDWAKSIVKEHHDFVLSNLDEQERDQLVMAMEKLEAEKGDIIIAQDSAADFLYVLVAGSVRFLKDGEEVGTASDPGEVFGELALLYDSPREATVEATGPCLLYRVSREKFRTIQAKFVLDNEKPLKLFKNSLLFQGRSELLVEKLAECALKKEFTEGEMLMTKGQPIESIYFLKEGRVIATDVTWGPHKHADSLVRPGDSMGEWGIVMETPSSCNLECLSDGVAYVLTKERFLKCTEGMDLHELIERTSDAKVLFSSAFFQKSDVCRTEIRLMLDKIEFITLEPGEDLCTIGDQVEPAIYWVSTKNKDTGKLDLIQRDGSIQTHGPSQIFSHGRHTTIVNNLAKKDIAAAIQYGKGRNLVNLDTAEGIEQALQVFHEKNLVTAQQTGRAVGTATVHVRKLSINGINASIYDPARLGQHFKTRLLRDDAHETLTHEKLNKMKLLGQGAFGQVWLCRESTRNLPYALKIQHKRELLIRGQAEGVVREATIMRNMHHPFVAGLVHAQQDPVCLFMVMQLFPGGELRSRMRNDYKNHMQEDEAKFYSACMLEGLSYMHRREYVYRDLKGENVLIDQDGYCVIVDLGFAKFVPGKTFTFCGTPIFLAPEILLNKGHDKSADIWSFGVMLFEMLFGTNPFFDYDDRTINQKKLFKRVVKGQFQKPVKKYAREAYSKTSEEARDLIKRILVGNPDKRLGCLPGEDLDIRNHPWFKGLDWGKLYRKEIKSPWVPELKDPFDGRNFNPVTARSHSDLRPLREYEQNVFDQFC